MNLQKTCPTYEKSKDIDCCEEAKDRENWDKKKEKEITQANERPSILHR